MGGAYGHLSHPYEQSVNLSFREMKEIIERSFNGTLDNVIEKTDGQALAFSWKDGQLITARNKGHLKNAGENAMSIDALHDKFEGRGELTDAFNEAAHDLKNALSNVNPLELTKFFENGRKFMNFEIMYAGTRNVLEYSGNFIVLHGTITYDEEGNAVDGSVTDAFELAEMLNQAEANVQNQFMIEGPPELTLLNLSNELPEISKPMINRINELRDEFDLSDDDTINDYYRAFWNKMLTESSVDVSEKAREVLISRWAFNDKSRRLREIPEYKSWAKSFEADYVKTVRKSISDKFARPFLETGAVMLATLESKFVLNPDEAVKELKERIMNHINAVSFEGSQDDKEKLVTQFERLQELGGLDSVTAIEGIVFTYGDHTLKLTGSFSPVNQLLGIMKY